MSDNYENEAPRDVNLAMTKEDAIKQTVDAAKIVAAHARQLGNEKSAQEAEEAARKLQQR